METTYCNEGIVGPGSKRPRMEGDDDVRGAAGQGACCTPKQGCSSHCPTTHGNGAADDAAAARKRRLADISVSSFYGSGLREDPTVLRIRQRSLKRCRARTAQEFAKQQQAFEFCDSLAGGDEDLYVFARETDGQGRRRFLVTTHGELFRRVWLARQSDASHYYELIREGSPCSLYFDIEFAKALNEGKDGDEALACFTAYLPSALSRLFPSLGLWLRPQDIVDMDSSTHKKFSRHLICKINGGRAVFENNLHMGAFMVRLAAMIARDVAEGNAELGKLYVTDSNGRSSLFVDMGVYTKNRCFRTAFSSKFGKTGVNLGPSSQNASKYDQGEEEVFFYRSLVCRLPRTTSRDSILLLTDPSLPDLRVHGAPRDASSRGGELVTGGAASEWPRVDAYVLEEWNRRGGTPGGRVRSVLSPAGEGGVLVYNLCGGNRWCEAVGRHHRSNGVMLIVDKARGVFYQKCYDPDCRASSAKSVDYPLPPQVVPPSWGCHADDEDDDAVMLMALEAYEASQREGAHEASQRGGASSPCTEKIVQEEDEWDEADIAAADDAVRQWREAQEAARPCTSPSKGDAQATTEPGGQRVAADAGGTPVRGRVGSQAGLSQHERGGGDAISRECPVGSPVW